MDELEKALKAALQQEAAPEGFSARVRRAARVHQLPASPWWRLPLIRWATVGVVTVACLVGAVSERVRQQNIRGLQAKQQVLLALHITGSKLRVIHDQVLKTHAEGESRP